MERKYSFNKEAMKAKVYNKMGEAVGEITLPDHLFNVSFSPGLIKQLIYIKTTREHHGKAHTKTRGEVRGGGRKPWRQKGTGRARHGSIRSPIWTGGGITFGPRVLEIKPKKINKKARRKALAVVLSQKLKKGNILFIKDMSLKEAKTREALKILQNLLSLLPDNKKDPRGAKVLTKTLVIYPSKDENARLALRNLPKVTYTTADQLNAMTIIRYRNIIMNAACVKTLEDTYATK